MKYFRITLITAFVAFAISTSFAQEIPFANEIAAYKEADKTNPPKKNGILFIGSSSIRKWTDMNERFPDKNIIMRGVGGSEISQWLKYYMPDLVFPYKPAKIFIYVGENDLAAGHPGEDVLRDFKAIYAIIQQKLPAARVYFMSIKPSPSREKFQGEFEKANALIKNFLKGKTKGKYVDVAAPIFGAGHQGDSTLFVQDMLHMNTKGYDRWADVLKKYL